MGKWIDFCYSELSKVACISRNPGFDAKPKVKELSPIKLKVEWGSGIMNDIDCVINIEVFLEHQLPIYFWEFV